MRVLEVRAGGPCGMRDHATPALRAYFEAQQARASRQFLSCAVPIVTLLLIALQVTDGLAARRSVAALVGMAAAVVVAAGVRERRAARKLHAYATVRR